MSVAEQTEAAHAHMEATTRRLQPIAYESARIRADAMALDAAWRALDADYYRQMRDAAQLLENANKRAECTLGPWAEQSSGGGWVRHRLRVPVIDIGRPGRCVAWVRLYLETPGSDPRPVLDHPGALVLPWGDAPKRLVPVDGTGPAQWMATADRLLVADGWSLEDA